MIRATALQTEAGHLADAGRPVPCDDGTDRWLSEDPAERAEAAQLCRPCPIADACQESADRHGEKFGVWGNGNGNPGRDRTRASHGALTLTHGRRGRPRKQAA